MVKRSGDDQNFAQVVVGKMEIASQAQLGSLTREHPEIFEVAGQMLPVVLITLVGMWRGDDVFDAVIRRHATHLQRHVPRLGTVVHLRQNMAMDIDHENFAGEGCK